jgi:hypothetical protein
LERTVVAPKGAFGPGAATSPYYPRRAIRASPLRLLKKGMARTGTNETRFLRSDFLRDEGKPNPQVAKMANFYQTLIFE